MKSEHGPARIPYLDYLRAAVVALVFLHHTAITYGAAGSWYYAAGATTPLAKGLLTLFVAYNQSWFMGFLFFLSGYLSLPSYGRKGAGRYVADRLRRFGIPLLVYAMVIQPVTVWLAQSAQPGHLSLVAVYLREHPFGFGVMWFVESLLLMDLLFVVWAKGLARIDLTARPGGGFPRGRARAAFAAAIGVASFLVRLVMPVGTSFAGLNICYFPSYIAMFVAGIVAWRMRWLDAIPDGAGRAARRAAVAGLLLLPTLVVAARALTHAPTAYFIGGPHWESLCEAVWEQLMLVSVSVALLHWGQRRLNRTSRRWQGWAAASYTAYMIQPVVIVSLSLLFQHVAWSPFGKFAAVGALSIVIIYAAARALRLMAPVRYLVG